MTLKVSIAIRLDNDNKLITQKKPENDVAVTVFYCIKRVSVGKAKLSFSSSSSNSSHTVCNWSGVAASESGRICKGFTSDLEGLRLIAS